MADLAEADIDNASPETRSLLRLVQSAIEELQAIGNYEARIAAETDEDTKKVLADAQCEEYEHFCQELEAVLRLKPEFKSIAQDVLFKDGPIVEDDVPGYDEGGDGESGDGGKAESSASAEPEEPPVPAEAEEEPRSEDEPPPAEDPPFAPGGAVPGPDIVPPPLRNHGRRPLDWRL